jgi:hypothetical protein
MRPLKKRIPDKKLGTRGGNMQRLVLALAVLFLLLPAYTFSQSTSASVSGTVQDSTGALIPGVSITAANTETGVVTTVLTNESGAYNLASLLPGIYNITAELSGFQKRSYTKVTLGNAERVRLNFTLSVGTVDTAVEVTVAADTLLATTSSSIGEILSQQRVDALPTIANNVMDFYRTVPGVFVDDNGVRASFAGQSGFGTSNIQRDGVDASGGARWTANALTATTMNPDLIGEVRVVVAPVDAEMGRGNAQIQFLTRSGTNQYRGAVTWAARNTKLDANTWNNNRQLDPITGAWSPTPADWYNVHNFVGSYGGPIKRNKTFFFTLWDQSIVNGRTIQNPLVLTPCARNGVFRYYDNWNNGNFRQITQATTATPTIAVVSGTGSPVAPATNPNGTPHNGILRYASVFGQLANVPTRADCSDAIVQGSPWDTNRKAMDPTGFVKKYMDLMPMPNNYEAIGSDGLNTAGHRWMRREQDGTETIFSLDDDGITRADNLSRKQINGKIDHNFNPKHKVSGSYTYEYSFGTANFEAWPDGARGSRFRRPQILSLNFTSTLSPSVVNEVRGGLRRTGGNSYPGIYDPKNGDIARGLFPNLNGYPVYIGPGVAAGGLVLSGNAISAGGTSQYNDVTNAITYADSLSWTKGVHALKFGGDMRRSYSRGYDAGIGVTSTPRANGGDAPNATIPVAAIGTNIPGLAGTNSTGNNQRMRNLLTLLSGSLASVTQYVYMQNPLKLDAYEDYKTFPQRVRETHRNELSLFLKDDWKVRPTLTLNLGLRWDWFGSIYDGYGMMPLPTKGPEAIFGLSGRSWDGFFSPGIRGELTSFEYVGKNSPNPNKSYFPNDWNNFGPAVGFAWQVPWFGAGKTTVRGGYQMTFNALPSFNSLTQTQVAPGSTLQAQYTGDSVTPYLDMTRLQSLVPVPQIVKPMEAVPVTDRTQTIYVPQPGLVNPYAQNVTLSVTHSLGSMATVDVRYVGTLGRKWWNVALQINQPNFVTNGLKEAFDAVRRGEESALLNDIFKGINIAGNGYGPVGSVFNNVQQTAGLHMRNSTQFRSNLANGNYSALATTLNNLNYVSANNPGLPTIPGGVNGAVLRINGYPENFIRTNPQFTSAMMVASVNSNNYHSLQTQFTLRPFHGINTQTTYTWSRNLGVYGEVGRNYTDPRDRHSDYAVLPDSRSHDLRTTGTFTLPFGPSKLFFGNSTGAVARILEQWSFSWITNMTTGAPVSIAAQSMLYANGTALRVGDFEPTSGKLEYVTDGNSIASYFGNGRYIQVPDPQCDLVTNTDTLRSNCTLSALADAKTRAVVLRNPLPGERGMSMNTAEAPGRWRFDANLSKAIKVSETKSVQLRFDARNVLNHPEPLNPVLDINTANFGQISSKNTQHREFQGQLKFLF